jgi:hypothetical protein
MYYIDVIKTYERIAEKGYKSTDLFKIYITQNADFEKSC